jgi:N-acetylglucosamine kinase-like BadF-type ATPase
MERLVELVEGAAQEGGLDPGARPLATIGVHALAGADFPSDVRRLGAGLRSTGLTERDIVVNDCLGALWAGSSDGWGVALICGQGINAAGVTPDGRTARFDGVGPISGDWGGGTAIGMAALGAAVRARDGRGPGTTLERSVPAYFGLSQPRAVTRAMYDGRIPETRVGELSPVVFKAARDGDAVAREIVDRLAIELTTMAAAIARRLGMARREIEIVLAGGVFRTDDEEFLRRLDTESHAVLPAATLVRLDVPPVTGAALEGLDRLGLARGSERAAARSRLREAMRAWRP